MKFNKIYCEKFKLKKKLIFYYNIEINKKDSTFTKCIETIVGY